MRIERGAGLIVGEFGKVRFCFLAFIQDATSGIAGKVWSQPFNRFLCSGANAAGSFRIAYFKLSHPVSQARSIKLIDRERADAALRAAGPAHQPVSASSSGVGQSGVHDLDELPVGCGQWIAHDSSIAQRGFRRGESYSIVLACNLD
jgi:hypothetical protein